MTPFSRLSPITQEASLRTRDNCANLTPSFSPACFFSQVNFPNSRIDNSSGDISSKKNSKCTSFISSVSSSSRQSFISSLFKITLVPPKPAGSTCIQKASSCFSPWIKTLLSIWRKSSWLPFSLRNPGIKTFPSKDSSLSCSVFLYRIREIFTSFLFDTNTGIFITSLKSSLSKMHPSRKNPSLSGEISSSSPSVRKSSYPSSILPHWYSLSFVSAMAQNMGCTSSSLYLRHKNAFSPVIL